MIGRERRDHRQTRQNAAERQHRFDAFTSCEDVTHGPEADAVTEQVAHGPTRGGDRRLVCAVPSEPGSVQAGDCVVQVRHRGDQRRPGLTGNAVIGTVEAPGMEAQRQQLPEISDAAMPEIGLGEGAADWPGHGEESACCFRRARRGRHGLLVRLVPRKAQKAARLSNDLPNSAEAARAGDQVKEVAMLARGRVGLMCS